MTTCIYKIENLKNNKVYIGSTIDFKRRIWKHQSELRLNRHPSKKLQNAWNHYNEENFSFDIIEECQKEELLEKEMNYITLFNSIRNGYNTLKGRKWDIEYLRENDALQDNSYRSFRIRTEQEIIFIKALQYVFGSIQRPLAKIFNTTSSSINYYYNNTRYVEVCKKFNDSSPLEKVRWFQDALIYSDFSMSLINQYNNEMAKLIWAYKNQFGEDKYTLSKIFNRSISGMDKILCKNSFPQSEQEMLQWSDEERGLKLFLFIIYLDFQRQSAAESVLKWAEAFNDYLEREYTISD